MGDRKWILESNRLSLEFQVWHSLGMWPLCKLCKPRGASSPKQEHEYLFLEL